MTRLHIVANRIPFFCASSRTSIVATPACDKLIPTRVCWCLSTRTNEAAPSFFGHRELCVALLASSKTNLSAKLVEFFQVTRSTNQDNCQLPSEEPLSKYVEMLARALGRRFSDSKASSGSDITCVRYHMRSSRTCWNAERDMSAVACLPLT